MPGPLREESPRHGGPRHTQGARGGSRGIFAAAGRTQALAMASEIARKWRGKRYEKVAEHLEEHTEECLTCLAFPKSHQRRIRATNGLERLNQEIKRRTRVVRKFPNPRACLR